MKLGRCPMRFALVVCAALLTSCTQFATVKNALIGVMDGADDVVALPDAGPPEAADSSVETVEDEGDYLTFVQSLMAESAKLSDSEPDAARATRAATAWRGGAEEE